MKLILAAAAVALLFVAPRVAVACSCAGSTSVSGSFQSAEAVFVGTVRQVENTLEKNEDGREFITGQIAHVQVDEAFKGAKEPELIFRAGGTSCDPRYAEGQRWLFYAYYDKEDKSWSIRACDRSVDLAWAAADLLYLRGLPESAQKTRLAGTLWSRDNKPLMGVKVKLIGERETREVLTDKNGVYETYGLPPGKYVIEPETPSNLKLNYSSVSHARNLRNEQVELKEKSCASIDFFFTDNTLISGRVFSPAAEPMRNVCLRLLFKEKPGDTPYLADCTDQSGRFNIDNIGVGEYFLVANDDGVISSDEPFPAIYYPGVLEKDKATVVTVGSGDKFEDFDIHIPSQQRTRIIEGRLLFSDRRPVAGASVEFSQDGNDDFDSSVNVETDKQGRFRLRVLEGLKGTVHGYMFAYLGEYENCPRLEALIKAQKDITTKFIKVEVDRDYLDMELVFPFPKCKKAKQ